MNMNHAKKLREQGFDDGTRLCQSVIFYHTAGHSSMMRASCEVPERSLMPLDENARREYMRGFGEGIVSTVLNE